jgi:hypothetical protein
MTQHPHIGHNNNENHKNEEDNGNRMTGMTKNMR